MDAGRGLGSTTGGSRGGPGRRWAASFARALGWAAAGLLMGLLAGVATLEANPSIRGMRDSLAVAAWLCGIYALGAGLVGAGLGLLGRPVSREGRRVEVFAGGLAAGVLALALLVAANTAIGAFLPKVGPARWGAVALLVAAAAAAVTWVEARIGRLGRARRSIALGGALAALALAAALFAQVRPEGSEASAAQPLDAPPPEFPLLLIGIDGADWRRIDALVEEGRLPTLARWMREGVRAPLESARPTWSPILWNTIVTGVTPEEHGVLDFTEARVPGVERGIQRLSKRPLVPSSVGVATLADLCLRTGLLAQVPVTSTQRHAKAVWNVFSDQGWKVAVVHWFASWPSEPLNGWVVSDHTLFRGQILHGEDEPVRETALAATHPAELFGELLAMELPAIGDEPQDGLALPFLDQLDPSERRWLLERPKLLEVTVDIYRSDVFGALAARHLLETRRPAFLALYLSGVDNLSHRLRDQTGVVERYYELVDELLGRVVEGSEGAVRIVVVSDHGWEYGGAQVGHDHAPDGIFLATGPGIRSGVRLEGRPSIYDVAPTLMQLAGLPLSRELRGRPIEGVLAHAPPAPAPVASYGPYRPPTLEGARGRKDAGEADERLMERLRQLGYTQ